MAKIKTTAERFIEFDMYIFPGKQFKAYMDQQGLGGEEDLDEVERLIRGASNSQEVEFPTPVIAKVGIDPERILGYSESFSLISYHNNPDNPEIDAVELEMQNGSVIMISCTLQEFKDRLNVFYKS